MKFVIMALIAGAFIGWNIEQPDYAKKIQNMIMKKVRELKLREQNVKDQERRRDIDDKL